MTYVRPRRFCTDCNTTVANYHGRGLCKTHYDRRFNRGHFADDRQPTLPPVGLAPILRDFPDQPATDPALTPAKVWQIAHRNATRATHWLVNTGRMTPDEAAALVMLSYAPPADAARRAA